MEKMAHYWGWRSTGGRVWKAWGSLWPWLRNWAYELLTGYGERWVLPLLWAATLAMVFFPLAYWGTGSLPGHAHAFSASSPSDIDWAGWGESFMFSLTSFATLSFTRLQPEGTVGNFIAAIEAMVGVLLFALFVFTLGNRMSRS
jgi:inward rectifier potassium channel